MQMITTSIEAISTIVGLNIHKGKSMILKYSSVSSHQITPYGEALVEVGGSKYLCSITNKQGGSDACPKTLFGKPKATF